MVSIDCRMTYIIFNAVQLKESIECVTFTCCILTHLYFCPSYLDPNKCDTVVESE